MKQLPTAGLITLKDKKLLLAFSKNKQAWYLPGGKIDTGKTSKEALIRELQEELNLHLKAEELNFSLIFRLPHMVKIAFKWSRIVFWFNWIKQYSLALK
ncbi:NUDIX domain-containing protein [Elizabethkingia ursingii]